MSDGIPAPVRVQVVGRGRMGLALDAALRDAGVPLLPPGRRGDDGVGADLVLLAVPDAEITAAAQAIAPGPLVAHVSGITPLAALGAHEGFSLHPLLTVTGAGTVFEGAHAAVAGTTPRGLAAAEDLARLLGLRAFRVADEDRAAYHAAASVASNFLVTLGAFAEELAATAGVPREALRPLAEAALRNWADRGAEAALTGPIVRGDEATVARQREAVAGRTPEQLELFDALVAQTRRLAAGSHTGSVPAAGSGSGSGTGVPA
ncbi:DUF2520 domain-containing protein [Leucobacter rhizosphaerae]|uniref:DUF2520 domain-containing protein n=1 Tax=Leucobacter rhizosphaerae TaxID=2932245 RepID=A0ABY4G0B9_9MICO|nr:Rossmann-like and DUF2520 domain-containing protein [Leucobacter rhizosphaerae]UOQ61769.1 DUF2520 domain-containing protein [Leucobacter rhizosphaerae]